MIAKIPPPKKGWRWLVNEATRPTDRFMPYTEKDYPLKNRCDMGLFTLGPSVSHGGGDRTFRVMGYIRKR